MKPTLLLASLILAAVHSVSLAAPEQETARPSGQPSSSTYTVKKGDSIERISRKTGMSASSLASANGLKKDAVIHPGQVLKVTGGKSAASSTAVAKATSPAAPAAKSNTPATSSGNTYTVNEGETYYSISKKLNISTKSLMAANPNVKANALRPGLKLNVRGKAAAAPAVAAAPARPQTTPVIAAKEPQEKTTPKPASKPATEQVSAPASKQKTVESTPAPKTPAQTAAKIPAPTATASSAPATATAPKSEPTPPAPVAQQTTPPAKKEVVRPITIDGEMTYGQFAQKHGTNPQRLNELNGLDLSDATLLAKGSELYIPAQP